MPLYEIYQDIVLGISISCLIGLGVAWILFLSNRKKWRFILSSSSLITSPPAPFFTWLSSLTLYVGIPAVCERRSILLRAFSTDNDLSHISFRTALRYSTQVKHRPVDTVTTSWSPQQPMSKNPYHHFLRFVALKSLIQMRFSISHCPITETASTLRRRKVRKGNQPIKKRENYHRMYRRCFMQLYEIYQNIVLGTSISCVIGLAVAWVLFLSNRDRDK